MVYCDKCGAKADPHDKYCRICGRQTNGPTMFWRIRRGQNSRAAYAEFEHRRLSDEGIESVSATNTLREARIAPDTVHSGKTLTQIEQLEVPREEEHSVRSQEELLLRLRELQTQRHVRTRRLPSTIVSYVLVLVGGTSLFFAVVLASTVLAFIGLGLLFWGAILLFARPQKYVQSDLMNSTALSSLKTIDRVMIDLGYTEKGIYLPAGNPEGAVVFVPSEPFTRIPKAWEVEDKTFITKPKGIAMIPPGLALARLIEKNLDIKLSKCSLETLRDRLPKLLIEGLEMVQDFEMHVDGDCVRFRFVESIYKDFCNQLRGSTRVSCALGCPICSAMACILTMATHKPVSFEEDKYSPDGKVLESSYRILEA